MRKRNVVLDSDAFKDLDKFIENLSKSKKDNVFSDWLEMTKNYIADKEEISDTEASRIGCALAGIGLDKWFNMNPIILVSCPDKLKDIKRETTDPKMIKILDATMNVLKGMILGLVQTGFIKVKD